MDFNPMAPIWVQVVTRIKGEIIRGVLPPGAKMPGGRELALQYAINPNTAARVYKELEQQGLCETRRGLGTYVTADEQRILALRHEQAALAADTYLRFLAEMGMDAGDAIRLIREKEQPAKEENEHA